MQLTIINTDSVQNIVMQQHCTPYVHDVERKVERYKREPLGHEAYQAGLSSSMNAVVGVHPAPIAAAERRLPRQTIVVMAPLFSG